MKPPKLPRYAVLDAEVDYLRPRELTLVSVHATKKEAREARAELGQAARIYDLRTGRETRSRP